MDTKGIQLQYFKKQELIKFFLKYIALITNIKLLYNLTELLTSFLKKWSVKM